MKKFVVMLVVIGLSLIPSVALSERVPIEATQTVEAVIETTETIKVVEVTTESTPTVEVIIEPPVIEPVEVAPIVESVEPTAVISSVSCTCDLESIRADIKDLFIRDEIRFDQIHENYDYLLDVIETLEDTIEELNQQRLSDYNILADDISNLATDHYNDYDRLDGYINKLQ